MTERKGVEAECGSTRLEANSWDVSLMIIHTRICLFVVPLWWQWNLSVKTECASVKFLC